ncbi:hypothetical protein SCHPADRAFT_946080 [Schizopora paradoxa]|uniref:Uncharacterized protein n=1 Tax=Schizopora paradoxa TaxID=27342 RepID=A0A0H2R3Q1_9AGAM|nr:hypothetical protein SCHPADRAFT_946080 [Schizopora paradoxa]
MPPYRPLAVTGEGPELVKGRNLVTIAKRHVGIDGKAPSLCKFTDQQKIEFFDLVLALGLMAQELPKEHLRDAVDAAFVNKKDDRKLHQSLISPMYSGLCLAMEHSSDCMVFSSILHDADLHYHFDDQPHEAIREHIYNHRPSRVAQLHIPELDIAEENFNRSISAIIPAFLNEKARRRNFPDNIRISLHPFAVSVFLPAAYLRKPSLQPSPDSIEYRAALEGEDDDFSQFELTEEDIAAFDAVDASNRGDRDDAGGDDGVGTGSEDEDEEDDDGQGERLDWERVPSSASRSRPASQRFSQALPAGVQGFPMGTQGFPMGTQGFPMGTQGLPTGSRGFPVGSQTMSPSQRPVIVKSPTANRTRAPRSFRAMTLEQSAVPHYTVDQFNPYTGQTLPGTFIPGHVVLVPSTPSPPATPRRSQGRDRVTRIATSQSKGRARDEGGSRHN